MLLLPTAETAQVDGELWPPAVSAAVPDVIRMMDDVLVDKNRTAGQNFRLLCSRLYRNFRDESPNLFVVVVVVVVEIPCSHGGGGPCRVYIFSIKG